ncbi:MAG TPA: serine hydrolase [Ktedonobacteraceae bacterium]|nr:serine hydrolase [Ktedonobacteraceae bacterium]
MQISDKAEGNKQLEGFEDFVGKMLEEWKVQGCAVAIIKDGEILLSKGFGLRNVAEGLEVTPETLFPIASCTKAFTATSLAILADEGKVDWDTPVRAYLPSFRMYDSFATERMTPRDLVTHRSGLPRHDLMWYNSSRTRRELFERLQYLEPSKDLRALWQYQNLMYMTAGYLAGELAGMSWEELVRQRIFQPLGMTNSLFDINEAKELPNCSRPYIERNDEVKEMPYYAAQGAIAPAGAIVSSISDMSKWVLLHANKGKIGDVQLVSEGQMMQMHAPQMVMQETHKYEELGNSTYGMGWFIHSYRGHTMVEHGGNIDGFSSLVTLFPRQNIGVVVLSNMDGNPLPYILTYNIGDRLLGLDEVDWNGRFRKEHDELKAGETRGKEKSETDRVQGTAPSHPLEAYSGDFEHPGYGTMSIELDGEQLKAIYNSMEFALKHYHYDVFEAHIERFDIMLKVSFSTNPRGDIETLSAPLEPMVSDIVFRRVPAKKMLDKSFLEQFTGLYEVMGMPLTVALKGEKALIASLPGQPDQELVPYKGMEFRIKGHSGFSVEFKSDEAGVITEALLTQPYGAFIAKKQTA